MIFYILLWKLLYQPLRSHTDQSTAFSINFVGAIFVFDFVYVRYNLIKLIETVRTEASGDLIRTEIEKRNLE